MHDATDRLQPARLREPDVMPIYARKARIVEGMDLFAKLANITYAQVAKLAEVSQKYDCPLP